MGQFKPEDFRKLWLQRQRPKNAPPAEDAEAEAHVTDVQLERAVDALKGVLVIGKRAQERPASPKS